MRIFALSGNRRTRPSVSVLMSFDRQTNPTPGVMGEHQELAGSGATGLPSAAGDGARPNSTVTRAEQRCDEILTASCRLFARHGYRQTDVQQIADAVRVGKGTIYRYFPTKEELFLAAVDRMMVRLSAEINDRVEREPDPLERLKLGVLTYLAFFDREADAVELLLQERAEFKTRKQHTYFLHQEANIGKWIELVRGLIEAGRLRKVEPRAVVEVISNALYGTIFTNHFAGRKRTFEEQAADIMDIVLNGLVTAGGDQSTRVGGTKRDGRQSEVNR
jgi:AcrR family transcriptional regulator